MLDHTPAEFADFAPNAARDLYLKAVWGPTEVLKLQFTPVLAQHATENPKFIRALARDLTGREVERLVDRTLTDISQVRVPHASISDSVDMYVSQGAEGSGIKAQVVSYPLTEEDRHALNKGLVTMLIGEKWRVPPNSPGGVIDPDKEGIVKLCLTALGFAPFKDETTIKQLIEFGKQADLLGRKVMNGSEVNAPFTRSPRGVKSTVPVQPSV